MSTGRDHCICLIFCYKFIPRFFICVILLWLFSALYFHTKLQMMPEHDICSLWQLVNKLWCENFTGYESGKGSGLRQPFWCSSASMDWLQNICPSTASWRPAVHICDQPMRACCLFRAQGQPTATGVLLSVDHSRGTVYLWHCVQVTSRRRLSEDIRRHFCLTVLTISYADSYRDIDSYVTILPSLPT